MNMFRDQQGMMALQKAGLPASDNGGKIDPAVAARVVDLIVNGPALSQSEQLSASGVNGAPFAFDQEGFTAARNQDLRYYYSRDLG